MAAGTQAGLFGAATGIGGLAAGLFGKKKKNEDQTKGPTSNNDTPPESSNEKMDQEIKKENDSSENIHGKFNHCSSSIFLFHFQNYLFKTLNMNIPYFREKFPPLNTSFPHSIVSAETIQFMK